MKNGCKKTIVLDLDETLIHCNENSQMPCDQKLPIKLSNGQSIEVGINIRPHTVEVLEELSKNMEIIVFTASHSCYANAVIDRLDPRGQFISHRLFREHCYHSPQGVYVKDLRIINRPLSQLVLVDNAAYSYILQPENGIPIVPFYSNSSDSELLLLKKYLQGLSQSPDVRDTNRNTFQLHRYREFDQHEKLVETLYSSYFQ